MKQNAARKGFTTDQSIAVWYRTELIRVLQDAALPIDTDASMDRILLSLRAMLADTMDASPVKVVILERLLEAGLVEFLTNTFVKYHRSPRRILSRSAYAQYVSLSFL